MKRYHRSLRDRLVSRQLDRLEPNWLATGLDPMLDRMIWRNGHQSRLWYALLFGPGFG